MSDSNHFSRFQGDPDDPQKDVQQALENDRHSKNARTILMAQFAFYRRLVSKKHSFTMWLDLEPGSLTDTELEQVVGFLKDAAHLPPG